MYKTTHERGNGEMSYSNEFNNLIKKVNEYSLDDVEKNSQLYFVKKIFTKDKDNNKKEVG